MRTDVPKLTPGTKVGVLVKPVSGSKLQVLLQQQKDEAGINLSQSNEKKHVVVFYVNGSKKRSFCFDCDKPVRPTIGVGKGTIIKLQLVAPPLDS